MPLLQLQEASSTTIAPDRDSIDIAVDIVAVHGLNEDLTGAWTDPTTNLLWLRDLLPRAISVARVLTFGYNAYASSFYGSGSADRIQQHAHTLIADLQADRSLESCTKRPIVFVCHGLGGILVKKALAYSSTRTSKNVEHLYSIFVSTYAILFFSTPHHGTDKTSWLAMAQTGDFSITRLPSEESQLLLAIHKDSETLQAITDQFAPLMKQFRIFFFWEELQSELGARTGYVVEELSAAPMIDNTERSGIYANHAQMVQFTDTQSSSYRTVLEALVRYCRDAPPIISRRWEQAALLLTQFRSNEALELAGSAFDVHQTTLIIEHHRRTSSQTQNKHFHIPQVVRSFYTGRENVSKLVRQSLLAADIGMGRQQRRFIIYGIGGSGKTQFCSKFAQDHRTDFWGVFWIDATSTETAKQSFANIGKIGGMEATPNAGKHWLSNLEEPWLLIVNNADDPSLDLQTLFPEGERGHILAAAIPEPWDSATKNTGNKITNSLGYLALALIQAGTFIMQKICEIKDYLDFYNQHRERLGARYLAANLGEHPQFTVYATWDLSLNALEQRQTEASMDAVQMLSIVAFFHFEHIRVEIFTRALTNRLNATQSVLATSFLGRVLSAIRARLRPHFVLPEFLRQEPLRMNPYRIKRALHELHSFSLISYDGRDDSFSLHPIVHAWARDRLEKGLQSLWAHISLNVLAESILLPPNDMDEPGKDFRRDILPHLDSCLNSDPIQIFDYAARFGGFKLPFALVLQHTWLLVFREQVLKAAKCGYVYAERGRFNEAAILLSSVKDALVASRGYQHETTMRAMLALSAVYWGLGRLEEAVELQKAVVEARTRAYGPENPETLSAMDQLGRSYWLNGQYKAALDLQTLTTARMKKTLGPNHPDTLIAMDNLGVTYGSWQRYAESYQVHRQVLEARMSHQTNSDDNTLTTMNNLAMACKDIGQLHEARELMTQVYEKRKHQLGIEHPWTLWALCNLAKVHIELKNFRRAEDMLVPGIAAAKRSLSEDHLGVLMGEGELARLLAREGRLEEAETLIRGLIPRLEKSRGLHHPDTLYTLSKLAYLYEQLDNIDRAIETCQLAADRIDDRLTSQHPLARDIHFQLEKLRTRKGNVVGALQQSDKSAEEMKPAEGTKSLGSQELQIREAQKLRKYGTF